MKKSILNAEHYIWGESSDGWHLHKSDDLSAISEKMPVGSSEVLHYHNHAQQFFYILLGEAVFEMEGEIIAVGANESLHIPKRTLHKIANNSNSDLTFLVVSEPKSHGDRIEIIEYSDDLKPHIKRLNYAWLEKYFVVEKGDEVSLSDPRGEILDKGGFVFYARINGAIVGTASLLKKSNGDFEVGKMAVEDDFQGFGIGTMLLRHCINVAQKAGIAKLILYSNTKLEPAIHLYTKFGFVEIPLESGLYERADIKMEKRLK